MVFQLTNCLPPSLLPNQSLLFLCIHIPNNLSRSSLTRWFPDVPLNQTSTLIATETYAVLEAILPFQLVMKPPEKI